MVFKVSVKVHQTSWYKKDRLDEADIRSSMPMHPVVNKSASKFRRGEYEVVRGAVVQ